MDTTKIEIAAKINGSWKRKTFKSEAAMESWIEKNEPSEVRYTDSN